MMPVRVTPVPLAATENIRALEPVPLAADVMVSHSA
jgi:hypothetical protein